MGLPEVPAGAKLQNQHLMHHRGEGAVGSGSGGAQGRLWGWGKTLGQA